MKRLKKNIASFRDAFIWHMEKGAKRVIERIRFYVPPFQELHQKYIDNREHAARLRAIQAKEDLDRDIEERR